MQQCKNISTYLIPSIDTRSHVGRREHLALLILLYTLAAGCSGGSVVSGQRASYSAIQNVEGAKLTTDENGNVVKVVARGTQMNDEQAKHLAMFSELRSLQIERSSITDTGLKAIRNLKHLETIRAERTAISDAGMQHLAELTNLKELFLAGCALTDEGLAPLNNLSNLTRLNLNDTRIADAGLQHLAGLTNLESLYLRNTQVRGTGLVHLAKLQKLKLLNLGSPSLTDDALEHVGQFGQLEMLFLDNSAISDEAIPTLVENLNQGTQEIKGLFLEKTQLTDAAVEPLLKLAGLKNLVIVHLHGTHIRKSAFRKLIESMPEVSFVADYPAER